MSLSNSDFMMTDGSNAAWVADDDVFASASFPLFADAGRADQVDPYTNGMNGAQSIENDDAHAEHTPEGSSMELEPSSGDALKTRRSRRTAAAAPKSYRHVEATAPKILRGHADSADKVARSRNAAQQFRARQKEHVVELADRITELENTHADIKIQAEELRRENEQLLMRQRFLRAFIARAMQVAFVPSSSPQPIIKSEPTHQKAQKAY